MTNIYLTADQDKAIIASAHKMTKICTRVREYVDVDIVSASPRDITIYGTLKRLDSIEQETRRLRALLLGL